MKHFSVKNNFLKILAVGLLFGIAFSLIGVSLVHAQSTTPPGATAGTNTGECFTWSGGFSFSACVSGLAYAIIYIISFILSVFVVIVLFCIEIVLKANATIVNTSIVQIGFSTVLTIANLGFVLGIIIIAIATILRRETYGIKSILWKLIIMAILVNFGLVISAPIINFANGMTMYFLNAMPGGSNSTSGAASNGLGAFQGFDNLSTGMAGLFQPQRLISPENASSSVNAGWQSTTGALGTVLGLVVGVAMSVVGIAMILIFLIVFFVMLLIRYVYLTVLLIMAPMAWMLWIFPGTKKYFSDWWHKFIKQAFFPPITMFFLWLIMKVGSNILAGQSVNVTPASNSGFTGFMTALGFGLLAPATSTLINTLVVIGLMMAGLTAGEKLSTEGSKVAQQVVGKARDSVQKYATRRGTQVSTAPLRTAKMRQRYTNWQQPDSSLAARWTGRIAESLAVAGGESAINKKAGEGLTSQQKVNRLSTAQWQDRIGIIEGMNKEELSSLSPEQKEKYFGKGTETTFSRYGKRGADIYKKAREESGLEREDLEKKEKEMAIAYEKVVSEGGDTKKAMGDWLEVQGKLDALNRKDPEGAVALFQNEDQRKRALAKAVELEQKIGKPVPASLKMDDETIKKIADRQASVLGTMVRSTSDNMNTFLKELSKKNNLKEFTTFVNNIKVSTDPHTKTQYNAIRRNLLENEQLMRSIANSPGKTMIAYDKLFDLKPDELERFKAKKEESKEKKEDGKKTNKNKKDSEKDEEEDDEDEEEEAKKEDKH